MLTLNDMFALPAKTLDLRDDVLCPGWVPEVAELGSLMDAALLERMALDRRLQVRELAQHYIDHRSCHALTALWFDASPVLLVRSTGQDPGAFKRRWIGDALRFERMCSYLREVANSPRPLSDQIDPDTPHYPEEFCLAQGVNLGDALGLVTEPRTPGVLVVPLGDGAGAAGRLLVMTEDDVTLEEYLRRGAFVMRRQKQIASEELARELPNAAGPFFARMARFYWYLPSERPSGVPIQPV
jgi:hypothetical protein